MQQYGLAQTLLEERFRGRGPNQPDCIQSNLLQR
jgi:hypothetical protein